MTATRILAEQHQVIARLFDALASETERRPREQLSSRVAEELIAHMALEGAVFLAAAAEILGEPPLDVHAAVRVELRRLLATDPDDPAFPERVKSARERFDEHVREEEAVLFPRIEREASPEQLDALAEQLCKRPPLWIVITDPRLAEEVTGAGPSVHMPGVASDGAAR